VYAPFFIQFFRKRMIPDIRAVKAASLRLCPLFLFCLFWLPAAAYSLAPVAQANISGIVTEEVSGEVVIGASVLLYRDSMPQTPTRPLRGAMTNKFGFYSLTGIEPGTYVLAIRSVGYAPFSRLFVVSDTTTSLRLDLRIRAEDVRLGEVTVEGDRHQSLTPPISTVELSPEFVNQMPSLGGEKDVFRVLQLLPGVKAASEISSGLYIRGGSPDQNLVLLDGVIVYNPSHLGGFLSTFNSDALLDIRLHKGAFPAEYGGRLSSVIDMTMREGTKEKIKGSAGVSLISSRLTVEGPINEDATFMVSGRRMYLDLLMPLADPDGEAPRYYFYDFNAKVNSRLSESDRIFVSGYFGRDVLFSPDSRNFEDDQFDISWGNATANVRWMHIVSSSLFTNFSFIYTNYKFGTSLAENDRSDFEVFSGIQDLMLRGEAQYFPSEDHTIKVGVESTLHKFRVGAEQTTSNNELDDLQINLSNISSLDASLYAQDEWKITPKFSTNIGARLYYFDQGNYLKFEPRLSASYEVADGVQLKGAFAVANQFLHLIVRNDITLPTDLWFPSTDVIKPSQSVQGVLGVSTLLFNNEYMLTVEGYYKTMNNLYEYRDNAAFTFGAPLDSQFTVGTGRAYGLEVFFNKRMGSFTGWIGYTLSWTQRTFPELNNGQMFYPRYDRRHDISLVLTYKLGESWELGATWTYGSGQAYTVPSGQYGFNPIEGINDNIIYSGTYDDYTERNAYRLPAFHKLDLNFMHKFSWFGLPWELSLNVYNAYNHKNTFAQFLSYDYDNPGPSGYWKRVVKRVTLFPFIPSVGLGFKF
jgi:outer membrane cobalamin receptor